MPSGCSLGAGLSVDGLIWHKAPQTTANDQYLLRFMEKTREDGDSFITLMNSKNGLSDEIKKKLKDIPEQTDVVGPLVAQLVAYGWDLEQIIFGKSEWRVPKSPSEATKREKRTSFAGFPVDIAVFDDRKNIGDHRHLLFLIECKQSNETAGISQLESYFVGEPHVQLGIWTNDPTPSAPAVFVYRKSDGRMLLKKRNVSDIPRPGEAIRPESQRVTFNDLIACSGFLTVADIKCPPRRIGAARAASRLPPPPADADSSRPRHTRSPSLIPCR